MVVNLRRIRSLVALAELGGFRAAAERLNLSQPALSAHIAELEAALGVALVSRTTRVVRLTPMGKQFLVRARRAVEEIETAVLELRDEAALERGRVIIACAPTLSAHTLPVVMREFTEKFPGITMQVFDAVSSLVERRVADGEADLGVTAKPDRAAAFVYQTLCLDRFVAVLPADHALAVFTNLALGDLASETMIAMMPDTSIRIRIESGFAEAGLSYKPRFEVHHHSTALGLVDAGLGVAILPLTAMPPFGSERIRIVPIVKPQLTRDLGQIHRRGEALSPAAKEFAAMLRRSFSKSRPSALLSDVLVGEDQQRLA